MFHNWHPFLWQWTPCIRRTEFSTPWWLGIWATWTRLMWKPGREWKVSTLCATIWSQTSAIPTINFVTQPPRVFTGSAMASWWKEFQLTLPNAIPLGTCFVKKSAEVRRFIMRSNRIGLKATPPCSLSRTEFSRATSCLDGKSRLLFRKPDDCQKAWNKWKCCVPPSTQNYAAFICLSVSTVKPLALPIVEMEWKTLGLGFSKTNLFERLEISRTRENALWRSRWHSWDSCHSCCCEHTIQIT